MDLRRVPIVHKEHGYISVMPLFFTLICFSRGCLLRHYPDANSYYAISSVPYEPVLRSVLQSPLRYIRIGQRTEHKQGIDILVQCMLPELGNAKHAFDHRHHLLQVGSEFRLGAVAGLGCLMQWLIVSALLVREIPCIGRRLADALRLICIPESPRTWVFSSCSRSSSTCVSRMMSLFLIGIGALTIVGSTMVPLEMQRPRFCKSLRTT